MRRFYIFVATGLGLVVCILMWFSARLYAVTDNITTGIVSLYSNNELFVFIGRGRAVLTGRRWRLWLERLSFTPQFPEKISDDLLVVHFRDGNISKYDLRSFGYSGSPFVKSNQVYWGRGGLNGNVEPRRWKWDGSSFVTLTKDEISELNHEHIADIDEMTLMSGWQQTSFLLSGRENGTTVHLVDREIKLYADIQQLPRGKDRARVILVQIATTNPPEALIDITEGYREIDKEECWRLKAEAATVSANR